MSFFSKLSLEDQRVILAMRAEGFDFLFSLFSSCVELDDEDVLSFSWMDAMRMFNERTGRELQYDKVSGENEKEVVRVMPTSSGYCKGEGDPIAKVVEETREIAVCANGDEQMVVEEGLAQWQWTVGRAGLADEVTYASRAASYEKRFQNDHKNQLDYLLNDIPEGTVYELCAGAGTLVHMRENVQASDLYPRHSKVKKADVNEVVANLKENDIVFLQYGYTFLNSHSRKKLRKMRYVVIDDPTQVVWLDRVSANVWSNCLVSVVPTDRKLKTEPNVAYSQNLLQLKDYQVYSENDFVIYLKSMGKEPSNKGPYIASDLKEYVRILQDIGIVDIYYAPLGKICPLSYPLEVGTMILVTEATIVQFQGERKYLKGSFIDGDTYVVAANREFEEVENDRVIKWKMVFEDPNLVTYRVKGKRVQVLIENKVSFEINDRTEESAIMSRVDFQREMQFFNSVTEEELLLLTNVKSLGRKELNGLIKKGLVVKKKGDRNYCLTRKGEKILELRTVRDNLVVLDKLSGEFPVSLLIGKNLQYAYYKSKRITYFCSMNITTLSVNKIRVELKVIK